MREVTSCEFNMDTACVELHFSDGSTIAISTIAVENEVADSMYQRSELDWLITISQWNMRSWCWVVESRNISRGWWNISWRIRETEVAQPTGRLIGGLRQMAIGISRQLQLD